MRGALIGMVALAAAMTAAPTVRLARAAESDPVVSEAVMDGTVDAIWKLITTKEGMESWIVPHAQIDLRPGGSLRTNHDPDGRIGDDNTLINRILDVRPKRMVSILVSETPSTIPFAQAVEGTWYRILLEPVSKGKTRVRCEGRGFDDGPAGYTTRALIQRAGDLALEKLEQRLAAMRAAKQAPKQR